MECWKFDVEVGREADVDGVREAAFYICKAFSITNDRISIMKKKLLFGDNYLVIAR
jgi:hypothetical protein